MIHESVACLLNRCNRPEVSKLRTAGKTRDGLEGFVLAQRGDDGDKDGAVGEGNCNQYLR